MGKKIKFEKIGYVYVIEDKARGLCKIGRTKDWERRVRNIVSGAGVKDFRYFVSEMVKDCYAFEADVHDTYITQRVSGEWFYVEYDEVVEYIKRVQDVISKEEYEKAVLELKEESEALRDGFARMLGLSGIGVLPTHEGWIFTNELEPIKELRHILVDLFPLSGVHAFEVLEYMDDMNAFCSFIGDEIEPISMDEILCWMPIIPPPPLKK